MLVDNDDYKALLKERTNMLLVPHWEDDDGEQQQGTGWAAAS